MKKVKAADLGKRKVVNFGWKHFDPISNKFVQIRGKGRGGGVKQAEVSLSADYITLLMTAQELFFPDGESFLGKLENMDSDLCLYNSCDNLLILKDKDDNSVKFTLRGFLESRNGNYHCRLYLHTRSRGESQPTTSSRIVSEKENGNRQSNSSTIRKKQEGHKNENDFDPDEFFTPGVFTTSTPILGSSEERAKLKNAQDLEYEISRATDRKKEEERRKEQERKEKERKQEELAQSLREKRKQEKEKQLAKLRDERKSKIFPETMHTDAAVQIKFRFPNGELWSRYFPQTATVEDIVNFVGSHENSTENFCLRARDPDRLIHSSRSETTLIDLGIINPLTIYVSWENKDEDVIIGHDLNNPINEEEDSTLPFVADENEESAITIASDDDNDIDCGNDSFENSLGEMRKGCRYDEEGRLIVRVRRVAIVEDLMNLFSSDSVMKENLKFEVVGPSGIVEIAQDEGGIFRDVISTFWLKFYNGCTLGENERVPVLRHDYQKRSWRSIARILLKGYITEKYWPIQLSKAFTICVVFGEKSVSKEILLDSFEEYVDESDRNLLRKFRSAEANEDDLEELLDMLDRYKARKLPTMENAVLIAEELAHKELIQEPKYVRDAWAAVFSKHAYGMEEFSSIKNVVDLISKRVPTTKKVLNMLQANPKTSAERDVFDFVRKFLRGLEASKLRNFLKFATGADVICVETIYIQFSQLDGLARRPIAHTCGCVLEVPTSYGGYPEFRNEWSELMKNDEWRNDYA